MSRGPDPILEPRDYSKLFFALSAILAITTGWAVYDEFVSRRTYVHYQREFKQLEISRLEARLASQGGWRSRGAEGPRRAAGAGARARSSRDQAGRQRRSGNRRRVHVRNRRPLPHVPSGGGSVPGSRRTGRTRHGRSFGRTPSSRGGRRRIRWWTSAARYATAVKAGRRASWEAPGMRWCPERTSPMDCGPTPRSRCCAANPSRLLATNAIRIKSGCSGAWPRMK